MTVPQVTYFPVVFSYHFLSHVLLSLSPEIPGSEGTEGEGVSEREGEKDCHGQEEGPQDW